MVSHCIGSIPELFDGNPPFKGRGAVSFAMNVAEILRVLYLLSKYNPNILVVTGHDCSKTTNPYSRNINDYKYSKYFIQSVLLARRYNPDTNKLVIIAGGCESYYESLIKAGANFASSPERISITITAPVYIAYRLFNTPRNMVVTMDSLYNDFHFDYGSFGGINTYGQCYK